MFVRSSLTVAAVVLLASCATIQPPPGKGSQPPVSEAPAVAHQLTPASLPTELVAEPVVLVGLLTDQPSVSFPRMEDGYLLRTEKGDFRLRRGFTVHAPVETSTARYAVQVAAVSDQSSAETLATKLRGEGVDPVSVNFDAGGGVYKVLAGDFESSDAAGPLRQQLIDRGYGKDLFVRQRPSSVNFPNVLTLVDDEGETTRFSGPQILLVPAGGKAVTIDGNRYRGGAEIFLNQRGLINVINEVNLEDYTRGVVPAEMGPKVYPELEAIKAQALAARTYAVSRKGDYGKEGYDLCATPACQVYKGIAVEDPLSDQAVEETAGQVITWQGEPIDALFTSTCGGETSDVGTMFPGRNEPYLKHVRCVELDLTRLDGRADSGLMMPWELDAEIFLTAAGLQRNDASWSASDVGRAVAGAAKLAGVTPAGEAAPKSVRRGDILSWMGTALGFADAAQVLLLPEDRQYYFPQGKPDEPPYLAAAFMAKYRIMPGQNIDGIDLSAPMPQTELYSLLETWLEKVSALNQTFGTIRAIDGRKLSLDVDGKTRSITLPAGIPLYRTLDDRIREYRSVPIMIGDRATLYARPQGAPVAMVVQANYDGAAFDRKSSYSSWVRSFRAPDLVASISRRNAIQSLTDLRPLRRDDAERVSALEVVAENGRTFTLEGLPIRWSLNLPDNLFWMARSTDPDGVRRFTFFGKGWGHGVGMCQVGAYGMAFHGWTADRIVKHYYTGVEIRPLQTVSGSDSRITDR